MSSKPTTTSSSLNPKRASGEALNPKRASGGALATKTTTTSSATKPATSSTTTTGSSLLKKKTPTATSASSTTAVGDATKGVAALKVSDSPPGEKRRVGVAVGRRRGDDEETTPTNAASSSATTSTPTSSSTTGATSLSAAKANQARRRLSLTAGKEDVTKLDGAHTDAEVKDPLTKVLKSLASNSAAPAQAANTTGASSSTAGPKKRRTFSHYSSLSKVGYVPFNPNKVNQDRSIEIVKFGGSEEKAFFGVFDGHGALGHEVSSFLIQELPKFFLKQANLDSNPHEAISKAFVDCNVKLASSAIDCTFSGSTGIVVYIANGKMYSCNAGDSRAVLARATSGGAGTGETKLTAVALSSDQKPEREDEKKRILENKGRVEACKGLKGEDIGPPRVWLSHQDVPGLAMTRSFGDLIAASVGVIAKPEVWERDCTDGDKFMILASDGVWEFISNQEAVDLVATVGAKSGPEEAVKALVDEATKRWHAEEEVVDDITAVIVYF